MAEFVTVINQMKRMCKVAGCASCPIMAEAKKTGRMCFNFVLHHPEKAEEILAVWSAQNPERYYGTYLEYLTEVLPGATIPIMAKPDGTYCPRKKLFCEENDALPCTYRECSCKECLSEPIIEATALRLDLEPDTEVRKL